MLIVRMKSSLDRPCESVDASGVGASDADVSGAVIETTASETGS